MPERVLVTGATGFVGSHIARAFAEAGHEVRCGVRSTSDTRWIDNLAVERVPVDLDSPGSLVEAVKGAQAVIHAAGLTRARRASDYHAVNADGTRRLAAAAAAAGVRRFVLVSSLAARGPDASARAGGDHPVSDYGRSKLKAENYLRNFGGRMETVVLRPVAVYGPRDKDFLPLLKMARTGWLVVPDGPKLLQPVYAEDVARAALAAVRRSVGFGPFPVAEAARYTWQDVAGGLGGALGRPVRAVHLPAAVLALAGDVAERMAKLRGTIPVFDERRARDLAVHVWTCDPSNTERALEWRAEVPLYEGLEHTVRWYQQAGWLSMKTR